MFNNCDSKTNGENLFFNSIQTDKVLFDVGCRNDTLFTSYKGEVHYFEPISKFLDQLKAEKNSNTISHYNNFGLSSKDCKLTYYPKYQSFYDRIISCKDSDLLNSCLLHVKKGIHYMKEKQIEKIHFLKIDTEGHELEVLKGFEHDIKKIEIIQFEYGGTYLDSGVKLVDILNYLSNKGFCNFSYLNQEGMCRIIDTNDHYQYCNIVCFNSANL